MLLELNSKIPFNINSQGEFLLAHAVGNEHYYSKLTKLHNCARVHLRKQRRHKPILYMKRQVKWAQEKILIIYHNELHACLTY